MEKLPTFKDLTSAVDVYEKEGDLMVLLNKNPPEDWVKTHPFVKGHKYLPIDKVEHLLKNIFREYKIEILREGQSFNGVYVVTRVHYRDVLTGEMKYHDGIGACELQTKKGESVANLNAINSGAISMAFPIAKTLSIKDACDHFGSLFGANLNRKDVIPIEKREKVKIDHEEERILALINGANNQDELDFAKGFSSEKHIDLIKAKQKEINKAKK